MEITGSFVKMDSALVAQKAQAKINKIVKERAEMIAREIADEQCAMDARWFSRLFKMKATPEAAKWRLQNLAEKFGLFYRMTYFMIDEELIAKKLLRAAVLAPEIFISTEDLAAIS